MVSLCRNLPRRLHPICPAMKYTSQLGETCADGGAAVCRVVFTESKFCHLLAGVIVVTGDDGSQRTFRAGDAFVSPAGFTGTWEIIEPAKKFYAYYE